MKIAKEIKVGLLAVVALVTFYIGFNYLKGIEFFDPTNNYYAVYEQIDGLTVSNPVLLSGLSVGRVSEIEILQEQDNKVKVYFEVNEEITLGSDSEAMLATDILGSQTIVLIRNDVKDPLKDGSQVVGSIQPALAEQIQEQAYPVLQTLDSVGKHLNGILANIDNNEERITGILENVERTTASLAAISAQEAQIKGILSDIKQISGALSNEKTGLTALLEKSNVTLDSLNNLQLGRTINRLDTTLVNINALLASMQDGEGTVDKLLSDDSLYNNLNTTLEDLDKLFIDLQQRPKRYVHFSLFGRKDKEDKKKDN